MRDSGEHSLHSLKVRSALKTELDEAGLRELLCFC
jgi:hypothetical protein